MAQRLVVVISDGRSSRLPHTIARRLQAEGISLLAISLKYPDDSDMTGLMAIAQDQQHVFTLKNIESFEEVFGMASFLVIAHLF